MRVIHFSTTDYGGAYKAAERISKSMQMYGIESELFVRTKTNPNSSGKEIFTRKYQYIISKIKNVGNLFLSEGEVISDYFGTDISSLPEVRKADIIFLHWVNSFISYRDVEKLLKSGKHVVWVMHDMWLFTGGCHCDQYCGSYERGCGKCPMLRFGFSQDKSRKNFLRKKKMLADTNMRLVSPSRWLTECAQKSDITNKLRIYQIANPIDRNIFKPKKDIQNLKRRYKLPLDKKIILFGAMKSETDSNKGISSLEKAMKSFENQKYVLAVFGNKGNLRLNLKIDIISLGIIKDEEKLADIYNCADVFVAPSNQESFGYTVCEALSCGTPVAAYRVGGIIDQIIHKKNGFLAEKGNESELKEGIEWCLSHGKNTEYIGENDMMQTGKKYFALCEKIINRRE